MGTLADDRCKMRVASKAYGVYGDTSVPRNFQPRCVTIPWLIESERPEVKPFFLIPTLFLTYFIAIAGFGIGFNFNAPLSFDTVPEMHLSCAGLLGEQPSCTSTAHLTLLSPPEDITEFFGQGDAGSYVRGAQALMVEGATFRSWTESKAYGTWPPGAFIVNWAALSLGVPVFLFNWILTALTWALTLSLAGYLLVHHFGYRIWSAAPALVFCLTLFRENFFYSGIALTEPISSGLFMTGLLLLVSPIKRKNGRFAIWILAGILVALAAYMRAQAYLVGVAICMSFIILALLCLVNQRQRLRGFGPHIGFVLAFILTLAPYLHLNGGKLLRVDYMYELPFTSNEYPKNGARNWLSLGGIRAACIADEERCAEIRLLIEDGTIGPSKLKKEIVLSFVKNPITFIRYKADTMIKYFFAQNTAAAMVPNSTVIWENLLYLLTFVASLLYALSRRTFDGVSAAVLMIFAMAGIVAGPFALHFEVRYLFLAKILMLFAPLLTLGRGQLVRK